MTLRETHPYNREKVGCIPKETRLLIVGTAPPPRFSNPSCILPPTRVSDPRATACKCKKPLDGDFFYGSGDNLMWEFLDRIADEIEGEKLFADDADLSACCLAAEKFLQRRKLWMRDVLQAYQRKPNKKCSALDKDIVAPKPDDCTNFGPIFEAHTLLTTIAFTSEVAAKWTFVKLRDEGLISGGEYKEIVLQRKVQKDIALEEYIMVKFRKPMWRGPIGQRDISFYMLPSPTFRSPKKGLGERKQAIYKEILFHQP